MSVTKSAANEVEVAKRKVLAIYRDAEEGMASKYSHVGPKGRHFVVMPNLIYGGVIGEGNSHDEAWLDAASRLPKGALPPIEVIDELAYEATGNHGEAEEVAATIRKMRAKDAGAAALAKHEFKGDVGYGVCDECGREKNDYEYHPEPAKTTEECPVCYYKLGFGLTASDYSICPRCGTEFGTDDSDTSHEQLRRDWINGGSKFWFQRESPPVSAGVDVELPKRPRVVGTYGGDCCKPKEVFDYAGEIEAQLLAARKETAELEGVFQEYKFHITKCLGVGIVFQGDDEPLFNERAEKAEAALARREEEIAKLKQFTFVSVDGVSVTVLLEDVPRMFHGLLVENARLRANLDPGV